MKKETRYLVSILSALSLVACEAKIDDYFLEEEEETPKEETAVENELGIQRVEIADEGRTLNVGVNILADLGGVPIDNPDSVKIVAKESLSGGKAYPDSFQPVFKQVVRFGAEELAARKVAMELLVDLTLPQSVVDEQQRAAQQLRTIFLPENMTVSFLDCEGIRETHPATDYVISNYFKADPSRGSKYLYRNVLARLEELSSREA
ncbi:MAG: hypothetical protein MJY56_07305, partial [Bacteroidales bacterium]|nr:hypothetical protein [Bacteroidales bacterium]